jgi:hypothetical protein
MRFPIATDGLRFRLAAPPAEDLDYETQRPKLRDGKAVLVVRVTVTDGQEPDILRIRTTEVAPGLVPDDAVAIDALSVLHWSMDGRSGLAFSADAIRPLGGKAPKAAA